MHISDLKSLNAPSLKTYDKIKKNILLKPILQKLLAIYFYLRCNNSDVLINPQKIGSLVKNGTLLKVKPEAVSPISRKKPRRRERQDRSVTH